jgi:hypothetical protein
VKSSLHRRALAMAVALWLSASGFAAGMPSGAPIDGIRCEQMEATAFHIHQHLAIFADGKPITIPADVGRPLAAHCLYWIHTHTPDGIIHIEAPTIRQFTLGNFFDIWGEPLGTTRVGSLRATPRKPMRIWVDGERYSGNPRAIELAQHTDVVIEVGPPFHRPAPFTDWGGQ